ncbi:hypothetical protein Agub_g1825, partial [Astrephomene gubernaculifera]
EGVLLAWLDASPEGRRAAAATPPPRLMPEEAKCFADWTMNELPNDYSFWLEQGMDPAHANFLHHGLGAFRAGNAVPMEAGRVQQADDVAGGLRWEHRGYEVKNKDMQATREFLAPFGFRVRYDMPNCSTTHICTLQVPVRPGVSRVYFKAGVSKRQQQQQPGKMEQGRSGNPEATVQPLKAAAGDSGSSGSGVGNGKSETGAASSGGIFALLQKLPHWLIDFHLIADQDTLMMCRQERLMRNQGLNYRSYYLNSRSDDGVAAINRWLTRAGYPASLWGPGGAAATAAATTAGSPGAGGGAAATQEQEPRYSGQTYGNWPDEDMPIELALSRYERHVRHCVTCQQGLRLVTGVCTALTAAAALATCGVAVMAMVAGMSVQ